jgi:hypothetical protein
MGVKYYVKAVPFVQAELPCAAHVTEEDSLSDEQLIDRMADKGAGFTRSNITGVMELFRNVVLDVVREGKGFHTRIFAGGFSIEGGMPDEDALFNPERNTFRYNLSAGPDVVAAAKEAHPQKVPGPKSGPLILHIHDQTTGSTDNKVTIMGNVRVTGKRLRIAGTNPNVGIFLRKPEGTLIPIDLSQLIVNKPGELIFTIPNMFSGQHYLLIVTQYSGAKLLKTPHVTMFDKVLSVVPRASAAAIEAPASAEKKPARKRGSSGGASAR